MKILVVGRVFNGSPEVLTMSDTPTRDVLSLVAALMPSRREAA